jgi:cytochrome c
LGNPKGVKMLMYRQIAFAAAIVATVLSVPAYAQNVERGKQLFETCSACHSVTNGLNGTGPHLHGLFGRKSASVEDYVYSPPLRRANVVWTPELLDRFLGDPQSGQFRGNKMPFAGMADAQARADLIAYLKVATQ